MAATFTPRDGPFDEQTVIDAFAREGLSAHSWSNGPGDSYGEHSHAYHKVLYCVAGSIVFRSADGAQFALRPGDRLDIEPGTPHAATVGREGVTCIEAARA